MLGFGFRDLGCWSFEGFRGVGVGVVFGVLWLWISGFGIKGFGV